MVKRPRRSAFTWKELFLALAILTVLALTFGGNVVDTFMRGRMVCTMCNMKQLYLATQQMAIEGANGQDPLRAWPGDMADPNWAAYQKSLVPAYLGTNDLLKILAGPGVRIPAGVFPNPVGENAFKVYTVKGKDSGDSIFIATRNWNGMGKPLSETSPYGRKGFVLLRKGGDATQYPEKMSVSPSATNGGILGRTNGVVLSQ